MIFQDVLNSTMNANKIQYVVIKVERKLKHEKVENKEKQLRITKLEQNYVELGADPSNPTPIKILIKEKDT